MFFFSNRFSVADNKATKMNTENLAKIFGPTVLGYSSADPDQHAIFTETMIQRDVSFDINFPFGSSIICVGHKQN